MTRTHAPAPTIDQALMAWRPPTVVAVGRPVRVALATALLALLSACGGGAGAPGGPPPAAPVSVAPATLRTVTDHEEFSGRLEAAEFVELRARVGGTIERVHFTDGALVKAGELLFTIDPRPLQAELSRASAQRAAAVARAGLASAELARARKLLEAKAGSRQEVDQLAAGLLTAEADIAAADAALRLAQLHLEYAAVRAPIAGRVSRAHVTAGNLIDAQVVLTTLAGVERLHAYFDGSEQTFLRLRAAADQSPVVRMGLANESGFPHEGRVDFIDNRLNPQTGAVRLRASFDNAEGLFTPGLAVRLTMITSAPYDAVRVPDRAIGTDQSKRFVYVVGADGQPQFREVRLGPLDAGMRVVQSGVKAGEQVIVDGLQRVMPGLPVLPTVLPTDEQGMPLTAPPPAPAASVPPAPVKAPENAAAQAGGAAASSAP
jgi:multidrug efflux system membrane fusion protein